MDRVRGKTDPLTSSAGAIDVMEPNPGAKRVRWIVPGRSASGAVPSRRAEPRGFALIELLAVLVVFGLLAVLALPMLPQGTSRNRLRALGMEISATVRSARTDAVQLQADQAAVFDAGGGRVTSRRHQVTLPADVRLDILSAESCVHGPASVAILFRPDGSSCGAVVSLAHGSDRVRVLVNWFDGGVSLEGI